MLDFVRAELEAGLEMMETYNATLAKMNKTREALGEALLLFGMPATAYPELAEVQGSLHELDGKPVHQHLGRQVAVLLRRERNTNAFVPHSIEHAQLLASVNKGLAVDLAIVSPEQLAPILAVFARNVAGPVAFTRPLTPIEFARCRQCSMRSSSPLRRAVCVPMCSRIVLRETSSGGTKFKLGKVTLGMVG